MELEITKYLVDFEQGTTNIEVIHTTTGAFGEDKRKDTVVVPRIESWSLESLQAAVIESASKIRTEKAAAIAASEVVASTKFALPLKVVK